jgi:hypothetical protein
MWLSRALRKVGSCLVTPGKANQSLACLQLMPNSLMSNRSLADVMLLTGERQWCRAKTVDEKHEAARSMAPFELLAEQPATRVAGQQPQVTRTYNGQLQHPNELSDTRLGTMHSSSPSSTSQKLAITS